MPKEQQKDDNNPLKDLDNIDDSNLDDDDYFEKLLNTPVDDDNNDPEGTGKKDDDPNADDDDPNAQKDKEPTREELENKIAELEKQAKGRLNDTVKSRQERRQMKEDLLRLQGAVASLFDKDKPDEKDTTPKPLEDPRKTVEFDDDKAIVDLSEVKAALKEQDNKTQQQLDEIKQAELVRTAKEEYDRTVNEVIDVNRADYEPAYARLKVAIKSLNDRLIDVQNRTDTLGDPKTGGMSVDEGIDLLDGTPEEKAFVEEFPGLNPITIARAFSSKRDLRVALDSISSTLKSDDDSGKPDLETSKLNDKLLDDARKKPNSLAGQDNKSGVTDALIEKIATLKTSDLLEVSDAEEAKIMKLLEQEELRGEQ